MPRASIVIPFYGRTNLLHRSLRTLECQRDFITECIVVDDGSPHPPNLPKWVSRLRIDRSPTHRGSSEAKNFGARAARSDYLVLADSDILHMPDAIQSMLASLKQWESEGRTDVLINVWRVGLPRGYPFLYARDMERLYKACAAADLIQDIEMGTSICCFEQNASIINRDYFLSLGGYDERTFRSWGFNNQDLCLRVAKNGGHVTSAVGRVTTGQRLACFHQWHRAPRGSRQAEAEFIDKWGEPFTHNLFARMEAQGLERRQAS